MHTNISCRKINLQVYSSKRGTNDAVITTCLHTLNARGGRFKMYVKCQLLVMIIVYVHKNPSLNPSTLPSLCYIMVTSQPLFGMERGVSLSLSITPSSRLKTASKRYAGVTSPDQFQSSKVLA